MYIQLGEGIFFALEVRFLSVSKQNILTEHLCRSWNTFLSFTSFSSFQKLLIAWGVELFIERSCYRIVRQSTLFTQKARLFL